MSQSTKIYAENRFAYDGVAFFLTDRGDNGVRRIAISMEMKEMSTTDIPESSFSMTRENTQELMDTLWTLGFRPTEGTGSAGALSATQDHIKTLKDFSSRLLGLIEKGKHE